MKRGRIVKADLILCGDAHLRDDTPICRTDDFQAAQWDKLSQIDDLQRLHGCPVYHTGDLLDTWRPSHALMSELFERLPQDFHTVIGNHDLPYHSMKYLRKSAIWTLITADRIGVLANGHWGETNPAGASIIKGREICVWHKFVWTGELPWPGCTDSDAHRLLKAHPEFDLIATGDNHKPFVVEMDGRLLVNVGSLMRQTADQEDYRPAVWLWYADTNTVEPVYLKIRKDVISREHIELVRRRDDRINEFINSLKIHEEARLDFRSTIERVLASNREIKKPIKEIIHKAMEGTIK